MLTWSTFLLSSVLFATTASSVELVSQKTVEDQKSLTKTLALSNGIPVIYRLVPDSEILQIKVQFSAGEKDLAKGKRSVLRWLMAAMPMAAKDFPREKMREEVAKYSSEISCAGSTEIASCDLGTVNDFFRESLVPFGAMIATPALTSEDLKLQRDRLVEGAKQERDNPGVYINHVVNKVFYEQDHPYRLINDEVINELETMPYDEVRKLHERLLDSSVMTIVAVGSLTQEALLQGLEASFGKIVNKHFATVGVKEPKYDKSNRLNIVDRPLPSSYIRAKIPAPAANAGDVVAANLMFEILSQKMFEEIRSKRSLSYTPFSALVSMSIGIGVLDVSTPKPKEALSALAEVIKGVKEKSMSAEDLEEYKHKYATRFFLTQEAQEDMANSIGRYYRYFNSPDPFYELPLALSKVTPKDIQDSAKKYLKNFRIGVITDKKKFDKSWIKVLP
jgi:zinc protease